MSDLQKRIQLSKLPPLPNLSRGGGTSGKKNFMRKRDYTPVSWDAYFDTKKDVQTSEGNKFRVYQSGTEGPVCFFLHGGGFSALSWAVLSKCLVEMAVCRCTAVDCRGHGDTYTDDDLNLSGDTLARDVGEVVKALYGEETPPIVLIGHSMGGAIAVQAAADNLIPSLVGLVVIDVVEGTALEALSSMQSFLRGRPSKFKSVEAAVEWCVRTGQVRNVESAKVSMVGQLKKLGTNETATSEMQQQLPAGQAEVTRVSDTIQEEGEDGQPVNAAAETKEEASFKQPGQSEFSSESSPLYTWRIDLSRTEKFWRGWFEGLSKKFLSCNASKMLLLAGVDRLDKDLTVGQMQGKFQMQVLPQVGHAVHEDSPEKVAEVLATFLIRHKFAEPAANFTRSFPAC